MLSSLGVVLSVWWALQLFAFWFYLKRSIIKTKMKCAANGVESKTTEAWMWGESNRAMHAGMAECCERGTTILFLSTEICLKKIYHLISLF